MATQVLQPVIIEAVPFKKDDRQFRNYVDSPHQLRVAKFYKENHENQTLDFVLSMKKKFLPLRNKEMTIWDAVNCLDTLVDQSDPDTNDSQIIHNLQTAESIRKAYNSEEFDWFHLVGFIHDLGKMLSGPFEGFELPQWCVVGDTFPVGCQHSDRVVFSEYFDANPDSHNPLYNTKYGIYSEGIGFDNVHFSWGHDEYMYQVCVGNNTTLPPQALYIIRYHSFYSWHQHQAYNHLASDYDREMLKWLKEFQVHDLYSKWPEKPNIDNLIPYYKGLIAKYFPTGTLKW